MTQNLIRREGRRGFTLIEIILVVVIIMTLMAVVGPRLAGQGRTNKIRITRIQMDSLKGTLQQYETQMSTFPTTAQGLKILLEKPTGADADDWPGKLVDKMPKDGFGTEFKYICPSEHGLDYDLISAGPDKKFGTSDDIANYDDAKADGSASKSSSNL
ncbi:type II secretion system major pseudopilin GspG [bacterium]|nr:type II secretion system major pseudopilin GspG [bacterium]